MPRDPLPLALVERLVWGLLDERPGRRPTMAEVGARLGLSSLQIRRDYEHLNRLLDIHLSGRHDGSFRTALTYRCLSHAAHDIGLGVKIDAARTLAGFRQKTSFVKGFRDFFGCSPRGFRDSRRTYVGLILDMRARTVVEIASGEDAGWKPGAPKL